MADVTACKVKQCQCRAYRAMTTPPVEGEGLSQQVFGR